MRSWVCRSSVCAAAGQLEVGWIETPEQERQENTTHQSERKTSERNKCRLIDIYNGLRGYADFLDDARLPFATAASPAWKQPH